MKLDILAFAAHPDDAELCCAGTLIKHIRSGYKAGIVDLTSGELGTRGNADLRESESKEATRILGLHARENLKMRDGFFRNDEEHQMLLIRTIRKYRPQVVLCNAINDRHTDHGRAAQLQAESCFLSGLRKIVTYDENGEEQESWRPKSVYHYIQDYFLKPDIVIDVTEEWDQKMKSIECYQSQFYNPNSTEPVTPISTRDFIEFLPARAMNFGRIIGAKYGEGFMVQRAIRVDDLTKIL